MTQNLKSSIVQQQSPSEIVQNGHVLCCCDWFSWISHWPTYKAHYWLVHVQGVQLGGLFISLLCYRGCWPVASVTVLTVARARRDRVRLRVGRHMPNAQSSSSLDVCSVGGAPSWGSCLPSLAPWPNELNQWPIRTQYTIAWLPVIILLRFTHVIFIEINVDKIINAFTKNFL